MNIATSPLSPKMAAKAAESRKHHKNDTKCSELGWQCIPLAVEAYMEPGVKRHATLSPT